MTAIIEIVSVEIDIITQEQMRIAKLNFVLEDRRLRLMEFLKSREELNISKRARENLIVTVSNMETKLVKQTQEKLGKQSTRRCRHYNAHYCKLKGDCTYYHSDKVCDQFLTDGKCSNSKLCLLGHPKECKFWI